MRIQSIRIQNLRSVKDETVELSPYTCFVGPNGAGKSTILCALNIFFRQTDDCATNLASLDEEDFHLRNTEEPVAVTVTLTDLGEAAKQDFAHYVRQDRLTITAEARFDIGTGAAIVKQYGERLVNSDFAPFFEAEGAAQQKAVYARIREAYPRLPVLTTAKDMRETLREDEENHPEECTPKRSEDAFYGVSKGANLLEKYVQWEYVPAVKDAASEQAEGRNTQLGRLLARTVRAKADFSLEVAQLRKRFRDDYQSLLDMNQGVLTEVSASLTKRLAEWSHPDATLRLEWQQDAGKSVQVADPMAAAIAGDGDFEGQLPRFGHGLQRSYLFALLQELATSDDVRSPTLVFGCEEPELYQHPPQARYLASVLQKLSEGNAQVLLCTHSPHFVSGRWFEDVRMIRKVNGQSTVSQAAPVAISRLVASATNGRPLEGLGARAKVHQALQPSLNEMFFAPYLILVEGVEDVAYITTYLNLMDLWDEYRKYGCHMVATVTKRGMLQPLAIARSLGIPTYIVVDADRYLALRAKDDVRKKHEADNTALLRLCGVTDPDPFPKSPFWAEGVAMWDSEIGEVVEREIGTEEWHGFRAEIDKLYGHPGDRDKNILHVGDSLSAAWEAGAKSASLQRLCRAIVDCARVSA